MANTSFDLTGNDYLSLPSIGTDASLAALNVIHAGLGGIVEWTGDGDNTPLLRHEIVVDGTPVNLHTAQWRRLERWIPTFQLSLAEQLVLTGTICAPTGYPAARGCFIRFEFDNRGRATRQVQVRLHLHWLNTRLWIASARPLAGDNHLIVLDDCLCLDAASGRGPALAIAATSPPAIIAGSDPAALTTLAAGSSIRAHDDSPLHAQLEYGFAVTPHRRTTFSWFVGAGRERDGACTAAQSLRRSGTDPLLRQARFEISHIVRAGEDAQRSELINRNLLFNRYYAVGRAIDDDLLYLMRSRSTRCPMPAVFNDRETLFWTLPSLILADPGLAREAIFRVYDMFSERSGEHRRYLDGGAFDVALVLDQLVLYAWIADFYVRMSGDESLLDEPLLRQVLMEADHALFVRLHPQWMLCATELLPSGDAADYPYSTMGNVLVWVFCDVLTRLWKRAADEPPLRFEGAASEIAATIWQQCTTDMNGVAILASSTNLEGAAAVYDDPALSLALLPFFNFCPPDDPVWRDTIEFLRSKRYPLWRDGPLPGLAARSDPDHGRVSALCADLLDTDTEAALRRLTSLKFPAGVAAGGYSFASGDAIEPFHAALAGFVAWATPRGQERKTEARSERRSRPRTA